MVQKLQNKRVSRKCPISVLFWSR